MRTLPVRGVWTGELVLGVQEVGNLDGEWMRNRHRYSSHPVLNNCPPNRSGARPELTHILRCIAWLSKQNIETGFVDRRVSRLLRRRFYRGGFRVSGLQTLWPRMPTSISCNVALGEPNYFYPLICMPVG